MGKETEKTIIENSPPTKKKRSGFRSRKIREYITGYLLIAPAVILIFVFGIFPVVFALYVSLHKWRIKRTDFIDLGNYIRAIDNLAYVGAFALAIGAVVGAILLFRQLSKRVEQNNYSPLLLAISGFLTAGSIISLFRYLFIQLPYFLDIADQVRKLEKTQAVFLRLLWEAFIISDVQIAWWIFFGLLIVTVAFVYTLQKRHNSIVYLQTQLMTAGIWLFSAIGISLFIYTFLQVQKAYTEAIETGVQPEIWTHIISIVSGVILLGLAWLIWRTVEKQDSMKSFWLRILAAMILLVGGWLLIAEIPMIVSSGDEDLWSGLKVTVFFSLGTVPFQLAFSLFFSILLFQKLRGSEIFRIIFFLPYVTPAIASAAVFSQLFSNRETSPANMLLKFLGVEPQMWLYEPQGIVSIIGNHLGFAVPEWAAGPSLALMVIIVHSIWTYVGYDIVIYLAGLGNIPKELVDAAEVDGANKWDVFRFITFPLLSPTTYFLSLIAIIGTFKAFNTIWIFRDTLALGTTDTFSVVIFVEFFEKLRYGYASALAFVLFAIILSLTYINNRVQGSRVFYG